MIKRYFLIIDQGTSGTKSFIFNKKGEVCFIEKIKHFLDCPKPLYVECDSQKIAVIALILCFVIRIIGAKSILKKLA